MTRFETLDSSYELGATLGKGTYSEVLMAKRKTSSDELSVVSDDLSSCSSPDIVAVKRISKSRLLTLEERLIPQREIENHEAIGKHPNAVFMYESYEDEHSYFLVLEMVNGGTLEDKLKINPLGLPTADAKDIIHQLLLGVQHLHQRSLVHVDISPKNILIDEKTGTVKLCDFGMTQRSRSSSAVGNESPTLTSADSQSSGVYGTAGYAAPEVSGSAIDEKADMWSIGMVCYELLTGVSSSTILSDGDIRFPDELWKEKQLLAKDFTEALLKINPAERLTIDQALGHAWFTKQ